mmetsp:Transcript_50837/g.119533  ORF Transcript_50837/g.119533 Transcript_50837/m.119533 type:complete len:86 (+) Transcript_50837:516-773(+)
MPLAAVIAAWSSCEFVGEMQQETQYSNVSQQLLAASHVLHEKGASSESPVLQQPVVQSKFSSVQTNPLSSAKNFFPCTVFRQPLA